MSNGNRRKLYHTYDTVVTQRFKLNVRIFNKLREVVSSSDYSSYMPTVFPLSLPFQYVRNRTMIYSLVMTIVSITSKSIMSKL